MGLQLHGRRPFDGQAMRMSSKRDLVCLECGKTFSEYLSKVERKYCSTECYDNARSAKSTKSDITGFVRGLLCENCNMGLGLFAENIEWLLNAVQYVAKWQKSEAQSSQVN